MSLLENNEIEWNVTPHQIHFENGYMNTKKGKFCERKKPVHITQYIHRDYTPSTTNQRNAVFRILCMLYPDKEDRELLLTMFSTCLSWEATSLQATLFLIGKGNGGKSTLMEFIGMMLGPYLQ